MTIGFIFECGPQGADKQVCEYLAKVIRPELPCRSTTLDNKPSLLANAPTAARQLLNGGCDCVLIVWDLRPAWPDKASQPCRAAERKTLLDGLAREGLQNEPVHLVCVEQELESWLLADEVNLSVYLSTPAHKYKAPSVRRPDQIANPKALVMKHFNQARGYRYDDRVHAIKVIQSQGGPKLAKLRRSDSFARFEAKLKQCLA